MSKLLGRELKAELNAARKEFQTASFKYYVLPSARYFRELEEAMLLLQEAYTDFEEYQQARRNRQ